MEGKRMKIYRSTENYFRYSTIKYRADFISKAGCTALSSRTIFKTMKKSFIALTLPLLFLLSAPTNSEAQTSTAPRSMKEYDSPLEIPVEEFFRNPEKSAFQISPDGSRISFLAPVDGRMNIHVQVIGQKDVKKLTQVKDRDIASYEWANNDVIVYLKDTGGDENFVLNKVDVKSGTTTNATKQGTRTEILDLLENDTENIIVSSNMRNPQLFDLYTYNLAANTLTILIENPGDVTGWVLDHVGTPRIAVSTNGVNTTLKSILPGGKMVEIIQTDFRQNLTPLFFDFDNKHVYCSSNLERDKNAIVLYDIERAREVEVIYEHPDVDVNDLNFSKKRKVITTVIYETEKLNREILDKEINSIFDNLSVKLPNSVTVQLNGTDDNETKYIVRTYSDVSRGNYYLYDVKKNELTLLENLSTLPERMMCEMKPIKYTSSNGFEINGYLTLPKNGNQLLPVVVNPHGGPWARDSWGYNPEVQFLASRGYAVLQMNFTGSVGYGRKFWQSSFKQWGQLMQNDITDGVNYLIEQRIADPKRIAIYGGSYGGYATLAGLTYTPELYACGIDYVGVSNLFTFLQSIPPYWEPYREMLYEMVGHPEKDADLLKSVSPVFAADKIIAPLLIAQGAKDPRVSIKESDQMVAALAKRGVTVEYMVEAEEGHGFHNEENRFKFYKAMEKFLFQHLGNNKGSKLITPQTEQRRK